MIFMNKKERKKEKRSLIEKSGVPTKIVSTV